MTKRVRTAAQRKKAQRFGTLESRRRQHPQLFSALERRERARGARLCATRSALRAGTQALPSVERRRAQYLEIPRAEPSPAVPRAILATIAASFVAPLLLAILGGSLRHAPAPPVAGELRTVATSPKNVGHGVNVAVVAGAKIAPPPTAARAPGARVALPGGTGEVRPGAVSSRIANETRSAAPVANARAARVISIPRRPPEHAPTVAGRFVASVLQALFGAGVQTPSPAKPPPKPVAVALRALRPKPEAVTSNPVRSSPPASPWVLSPDGMWVATVHAPSMSGAAFAASTGQLIEFEPSAVAPDEATVTIGWARPVIVNISAQGQTLTKTLPAPDDGAEAFDIAVRAVGPHLINVGWTPLADSVQVSQYEVFRSSGEGERPELVATLPGTKHAYHDAAVTPDSRYRYSVAALTSDESIQASAATVQTPAALPAASARIVSGKGMFLYFSSLPSDPRNFHRYDPARVIAEAQRAGIHVIELRMARGACTMAQTDAAHEWLDRLIDHAASAGIKLLAWTVPRRATTQDLAETIAAAEYQTPNGNGFQGLALDLETGDNYMGDGPKARERMIQYIRDVRAAAGPEYLIVATVASPRFGTQGDYPYAPIARYADVLQPMEYWHYFDETAHHEYARDEVATAAALAVAQTRHLAGRDIPVDVAGQSVALAGTDAPSGREIRWSLDASKSEGAIGETFFDWAGTGPDAWAAIQAFDW